jgi:moderate conductance mechanosensitive channel
VTPLDPYHARARKVVRLLLLIAFVVAALAGGSVVLDRFGVAEPRWHPREIVDWMLSHGINIVIIIVGAAIVIRAASVGIERLQRTIGGADQHDLEWHRRASTLGGILTSLVTVAVGFVALMMLLRELSIDVLPILTGAGIAGLAVGFGAQNLVRDVISGFFLILEDQVRVGDAARINGVSGTVEQINLRTIVVRDEEGAVQVFPNGTITALANLSKQFAFAIVAVRIAYDENVDVVFRTLKEIGTAMQQDPMWGPLVLDTLEVPGIQSLSGGTATIKVRFRTLPLNQGSVANELRRRIMTTFVAKGIRPYSREIS